MDYKGFAQLLHNMKKEKIKYNLTFWQRLSLPLIWLFWITEPVWKVKTWHEVKKGMEKHKHRYTKPFYEGRFLFHACEHEGCNMFTDFDFDAESKAEYVKFINEKSLS